MKEINLNKLTPTEQLLIKSLVDLLKYETPEWIKDVPDETLKIVHNIMESKLERIA